MTNAAAEELKRTKEERDYFKAAYTRKLDECIKVLSQLSASEERVREQLAIIRDRAQGELEDAETLVQARAGLQAIASYVESLLPSPPQVIRG